MPTTGILIFVGLYIYASTLYPGGSQADSNSVGFDWINNYWCDLTNEYGVNRMHNPARPFAISAMTILCISLTIFFIQFARKLATNPFWKSTIQVSGTISMIFAILIFTKYHDLMTIIASFFGLLVLVGIIREVYKSEMTKFKISGITCIILLIMNNYMYYGQQLVEHLPLIQKITFVFILIWIIGLNYKLTEKNTLQRSA